MDILGAIRRITGASLLGDLIVGGAHTSVDPSTPEVWGEGFNYFGSPDTGVNFNCISDDATVILTTDGKIWNKSLVQIDTKPDTIDSLQSLSRDGNYFLGMNFTPSNIYWKRDSNTQHVLSLPGGFDGMSLSQIANNGVTAGALFASGVFYPYYWQADGSAIAITPPAGYDSGISRGISADGDVVCGVFYGTGATAAFKYVVSTTDITLVIEEGANPGVDCYCISGDGLVIGGPHHSDATHRGYIHDDTHGVVHIDPTEVGEEITPWALSPKGTHALCFGDTIDREWDYIWNRTDGPIVFSSTASPITGAEGADNGSSAFTFLADLPY